MWKYLLCHNWAVTCMQVLPPPGSLPLHLPLTHTFHLFSPSAHHSAGLLPCRQRIPPRTLPVWYDNDVLVVWRERIVWLVLHGFLGGSESEESACNAGDLGSIPGIGKSPAERNDNPLQYSWMENSMDRGAWWATVYGVAKSRTWLSDWHTDTQTHTHPSCVVHRRLSGNVCWEKSVNSSWHLPRSHTACSPLLFPILKCYNCKAVMESCAVLC